MKRIDGSKSLKDLLKMVFSFVELSLILRFGFKILGANSEVGFVSFIYQKTLPLLSPFFLAFPSSSINGKFIIEFATLFAVFVIAFIAYLIQEFLDFINSKK